MGNVPIQERSVDPYSSYDSNVVNKLTRLLSDGKDCLLLPTPIRVTGTLGNNSTNMVCCAGKAIKDDVLIETQQHNFDMHDWDNYVVQPGGLWGATGMYYVVLEYSYDKVSPAPTATIKLIAPSQRTTVYDPNLHLFINCINVQAGLIIAIHDWDPEYPSVRRNQVGGAGGDLVQLYEDLDWGGEISSDTTLVICDTVVPMTQVTLPPLANANHVIRIIRMSDTRTDTNGGTELVVQCRVGETIEGLSSISMDIKYDAVSLVPYPAKNVWIQV